MPDEEDLLREVVATAPQRRSTAAVRSRRAFPQIPDQETLATTAQLLEAGWTYSAIRYVGQRHWQSPYPGVYAPHRGELSAHALVTGGSLWAGPGAVLTGVLALRYLGLDLEKRWGCIFLVPERCRARTFEDRGRRARTVRTSRPVPIGLQTQGLLVVRAARAAVDAAVMEGHVGEAGEHLAIAVLQRGLCTPEELDAEAAGRSQAKVAGLRRGVQAFVEGAWSRPEAVLRSIVEAIPDMPPLLSNVRLRRGGEGIVIGVPDGYVEAAGVVIQVHSRAHHQGIDGRKGSRWAATVEKDADYGAAGLIVVPVTPWTLYKQPHVFVARLTSAVRAGLKRPPPDVVVESVNRPRA